ncbi:hypothetical protein [Mangrovibacterium lignilyticum]|nr:hypothetical protein [Mangrovibacterium lignilyticum]
MKKFNPLMNIITMDLDGYSNNETPYDGIEYTLNHLQLTKEIKSNISLK